MVPEKKILRILEILKPTLMSENSEVLGTFIDDANATTTTILDIPGTSSQYDPSFQLSDSSTVVSEPSSNTAVSEPGSSTVFSLRRNYSQVWSIEYGKLYKSQQY